ncbi:MAG: hypothetical protein AB1Z63_15210 [Candidatus Limnocylindrales bacterium]
MSMQRSARGLMAVLGGVVLVLGLLGGVAAAPPDDERAALYEVRADLVDALREIKADLARYRSYRDEPAWYIVDQGWGYVDLERLPDHVPIVRYLHDHPGALELLSAWPFWLDAPFLSSVSLLLDESSSSADVGRTAAALASGLSQTRDEKASLVRERLQLAREERELTITAIDTLDAIIERLGLPVPSPSAADVVMRPQPTPAPGTAGVMAAFREDLADEVASMRERMWSCRQWIDDPDVYVEGDYVLAGFDLARLPDFERAVELIRDDVGAWAIFDAPAARGSDLDIATRLYLDTFDDAPADLAEIAADVIEANRQTAKQKRNRHCVEILGEGKRNRDALVDALATADEIAAALGLVPEAAPTLTLTPRPTQPPAPEPTSTPTPEPEPTPEPTPVAVPDETPPPNPFADL